MNYVGSMYFAPIHSLVKVAFGFSVGDYVLFGRFRNKRAKIVKVFEKNGIPYIEVQPIPKGRKSNRTFGLYTIRKMSPEVIAETKAIEKEYLEAHAKKT